MDISNEKSVLAEASRVWGLTYGRGLEGEELERSFEKLVNEEGPASDEEKRFFFTFLTWLGTWAEAGFPKIVFSGHKYASALMCTKASSEAQVRLPWRSFVLSVPDRLLVKDGLSFLRLNLFVTLHGFYCLHLIREDGVFLEKAELSLEKVLYEKGAFVEEGGGVEPDDVDQRLLMLAQRLLVGALYTLQNTTNFTDKDHALTKRPSHRDGPPKHRVVVVGRPITVDMRPAVRSYLEGMRKGGPPSVQSLVRGHYRRQQVSLRHRADEVIWIEPYWRGPEDAPILARPYKV